MPCLLPQNRVFKKKSGAAQVTPNPKTGGASGALISFFCEGGQLGQDSCLCRDCCGKPGGRVGLAH